ncbi:dTDP-glucose 4,6-dehydratase [Anabaena cylindrica UHCC 0172]|uniref:dTDP-glucose 4,6-dehydratase n=1 Tax=Anabaena cylindrica TaxID=1165 RepID=UPI002B1FAF6A|nr:dTDP-glucose 4,6-dehydratase [Anabaena cylindrica]MEA5552941.1 dTDP-glucose 4,6-dehydratase [Anabaena cylindrica UHCC 0172]
MSNFKKDDMPTLLVTGGAGFIGANFVLQARKEKWANIINLDKLTYASNLQNLASVQDDPHYCFIQGDINNFELVSYLLNQYQPDGVINFAAETHVDRSILSPQNFIQTNVVGTFQLLESSKVYWQKLTSSKQENFRFLHISTDEVYGSLNFTDPAFREDTPYTPNSPYAASKAGADHLVRSYYHTYELPTLTTNCSNNYGPWQFPEKLIPLTILNALNAKPLPIYGDGQNIRDWLYVGDHCEAIYLVFREGSIGETYNIGGINERTNLVVVEKICAILDELAPKDNFKYSSLITFIKDRPGHDRRYAIDSSKISKDLGWQPKENFDSGLLKTVQWYLNNSDWVDSVCTGTYQNWIKQNYETR